jgi:protein gp37
MALGSGIEWTESTWNPVTGCDKISPGCKHCYAERMAERLQAMGQSNYRNGFELTLQPKMLALPLTWKKPQTIFVNSMSDLFHDDVPVEYIQRVFEVMGRAHWHRFQVLTKRAERLAALAPQLSWTPNVWMGVSVENADYLWRIDHLRETSAAVKFLSLEPLLGPLSTLNLRGIDWVIVGGESGFHARPMNEAWVVEIRQQVSSRASPVFLQAVGRREQEEGRAPARRKDVGRDARRPVSWSA